MTAFPAFIEQGRNNFVRNVAGMWDGMRLRDYIRIIVIVGAYLLVRPYLLQLAAKIQAKEYAKRESQASHQSSNQAKISPNYLRHAKTPPRASEKTKVDYEGESIASGTKWGQKSMKRKVQPPNHSTEACEQIGQELNKETHDEGIYKYLVDYEEGEDGW